MWHQVTGARAFPCNCSITPSHTRAHLLLLSVTSSTLATYRLYQKAGICQYGQEPDAIKLGDSLLQ